MWTDVEDDAFERNTRVLWFAHASDINARESPGGMSPIANLLAFRLIRKRALGWKFRICTRRCYRRSRCGN